MAGQKPVFEARWGTVKVARWDNTVKKKDGTEFVNTNYTFVRGYNDGKEWKDTNSYRVADLIKLRYCIDKAIEDASSIKHAPQDE